MPASRKNRSVQGARRTACRMRRSCSASVLPSAYAEVGLPAVILAGDCRSGLPASALPCTRPLICGTGWPVAGTSASLPGARSSPGAHQTTPHLGRLLLRPALWNPGSCCACRGKGALWGGERQSLQGNFEAGICAAVPRARRSSANETRVLRRAPRTRAGLLGERGDRGRHPSRRTGIAGRRGALQRDRRQERGRGPSRAARAECTPK
jgi:hypothetical protein